MIITGKKPNFAAQKRHVVKEISRLREEVEDLMDYLDLLEARAKNKAKRTYNTAKCELSWDCDFAMPSPRQESEKYRARETRNHNPAAIRFGAGPRH
jgi:hypothetical protein